MAKFVASGPGQLRRSMEDEKLDLNPKRTSCLCNAIFFFKEHSSRKLSIIPECGHCNAQRCHEVAHKYCVNYLPILLEACSDKNSEIKEEAAWGIRICAEFGAPQFKPFVNRVLSELSILMEDPNRTLSENAKAYDVAVSALGRICEFHRDSIGGSQIR